MKIYKKIQSKIHEFIQDSLKNHKILTENHFFPSFQLTENTFINKLAEVIESDFIYNHYHLNYENILKCEKDISLQKKIEQEIENIPQQLKKTYQTSFQYQEIINKSLNEFFLDKLKDNFISLQSLYSQKEHIYKEYDANQSLSLTNQANRLIATLIILSHPKEGFKNIKDNFLQQIKIINPEMARDFTQKIKNPSDKICEEIFKTHSSILKDINPKQYLNLQAIQDQRKNKFN